MDALIPAAMSLNASAMDLACAAPMTLMDVVIGVGLGVLIVVALAAAMLLLAWLHDRHDRSPEAVALAEEMKLLREKRWREYIEQHTKGKP